jgi:serine phosphatase RsbU (regulator of sigma subunit)
MSRDALLAETLAELSAALVDDFDVVELLTRLTGRCLEVLDVAAAGVMLVDREGDLRVVASSSEEMRLVELFEIQAQEGPCPDCYRSGEAVFNEDLLIAAVGRWPRFGPVALEAGFRSVHALPLRLQGKVIGALNLFVAGQDWQPGRIGPSGEVDTIVAQAMADMTTMVVNDQLHAALSSRVMIEQAKGFLAERVGLDMEAAFAWLRDYAASHNLRLADVAHSVIARFGGTPRRRIPGGVPPFGLAAVLRAASNAPPHQVTAAVATELARIMNAQAVAFMIADYSGKVLVRLDGPGQVQVSIGNSPQGTVLATQTLTVERTDTGFRVLVPVTNRGDAIGVLELTLPLPPTESLRQDLTDVAQLLAYVIVANRAATDVFEWGQRTRPFNLAAEIQHRLMPAALTCEAGVFTLAGWVEPACRAGGDTFDYVVNQDTLWLSLTDAMGHGVAASQLATLLVGALRHQRRSGASPTAAAEAANTALLDHSTLDQFVTGIALTVDLPTGVATVINAGHPLPLLLRGGIITPVPVPAAFPFGMFADTLYPAHEFVLRPGDRLFLVSDGIIDSTDPPGHHTLAVDTDLADLLTATAALHPREAARSLCDAAIKASRGGLRDDATVVILDWHQ